MDSRHQAHTRAPGPALVRLLARLAGVDAPPPTQALSARLSHWVDWPQAVALSSALDAHAGPASPDGPDAACASDECDQVRAAIIRMLERDRAFAAGSAEPGAAFYRQRYAALQQMMGAEVDLLRRRLRQRLVQRGAALARLAAVDAVLEKAMGARERALLSALADHVAAHFERLRPASETDPPAAARTWLAAFRRDMKCLLVAELDVRLQPARGLFEALGSTPDAHAQ
ncbi:MAG: DUF3348 family protein [Pseudomonadota bacterium]